MIIHADYEGATLISGPPRTAPADPLPDASAPIVPIDVVVLAGIAVASALGSLGLSNRYRRLAGTVSVGLAASAALWVGVFPRVLALLPTNY